MLIEVAVLPCLEPNLLHEENQMHSFLLCLWEFLWFNFITFPVPVPVPPRKKVTVPTVPVPQYWVHLFFCGGWGAYRIVPVIVFVWRAEGGLVSENRVPVFRDRIRNYFSFLGPNPSVSVSFFTDSPFLLQIFSKNVTLVSKIKPN